MTTNPQAICPAEKRLASERRKGSRHSLVRKRIENHPGYGLTPSLAANREVCLPRERRTGYRTWQHLGRLACNRLPAPAPRRMLAQPALHGTSGLPLHHHEKPLMDHRPRPSSSRRSAAKAELLATQHSSLNYVPPPQSVHSCSPTRECISCVKLVPSYRMTEPASTQDRPGAVLVLPHVA